MRADWIRADKFNPKEVGRYLVTTCKGNITIDRWDGDGWGMCQQKIFSKHPGKGVYRPHRAWTFLPKPASEEES